MSNKSLDDILKRFPEICNLFTYAKKFSRCGFEKRTDAINRLYEWLGRYVGWHSPDPEYNTSKEFDTVAMELLKILKLY